MRSYDVCLDDKDGIYNNQKFIISNIILLSLEIVFLIYLMVTLPMRYIKNKHASAS